MRPWSPILLTLLGCSEYGLEEKVGPPVVTRPEIEVTPASLDFGDVAVACPTDLEVTVTNVGSATLDISGTEIRGDGQFSASYLEELLVPGASATLTVRYTPTAEGDHAAELIIYSNDDDEADVEVPAAGVADDTVLWGDTFVQDADPVDVLWVIDNSSSMGQEQARVIAEINAFFSWFETLNLDYHMGVVTSDVVTATMAGRLQGSPTYIENGTANAEAELAEAINVGTDDQGDESGLYAAELALSEPVLSAENAGFLRTNAHLVVVFLSDEPEQSAFDAQHYIDFFATVKADPADVLVNAIVGDETNGCASVCDGTDQTATPGDKYIAVVDAYQGVFGSICTCDLSPTLDEIGMESTRFVRTFPLSRTPADPTAIRVDVDGERTDAWTYDEAANSIVFDDAPINGQAVDATYPVALTCDA